MGWEAVATVGSSLLSSRSTMKQGQANANAEIQQAGYEAKDTADNTLRTAGKLQTSFLQSGLSLEGGPMAVLMQAFAKGTTDIGRITSNANTAAKNDINTARTKALQGLSTGVVSGSSSIFSGLDGFSTDVGNGLSSSMNGTGFDLGYQASQDFRTSGGGFAPGQFK